MDPVCQLWDDQGTQGRWSGVGVDSAILESNIGEEVRQFRVRCSSSSLTAFGVAVNTDIPVSILLYNYVNIYSHILL